MSFKLEIKIHLTVEGGYSSLTTCSTTQHMHRVVVILQHTIVLLYLNILLVMSKAVRKICSPGSALVLYLHQVLPIIQLDSTGQNAIYLLSHAIQFCSYSGAPYTCVAPLLSSVIANCLLVFQPLISNCKASVHDPLACYSRQLIKADVYMRFQMILYCSLYSRLVENTDTFIFDGIYYPNELLNAISTCIKLTVIKKYKTKQA